MKNNIYFQSMNQTSAEFKQARRAREAEKDAILEAGDWAALDAWHEREKNIKYPFSDGQEKAYRAWNKSVRNKSNVFEVEDLPWEKDAHDFVETLRAARIAEFAITDQSTALMRLLHLLAAEGCAMQGLCEVRHSEARRSVTERAGILFRT